MRSSAPFLCRPLPALVIALSLAAGSVSAAGPASAAPLVASTAIASSTAASSAVAPQPTGWPRFEYQGAVTDKATIDYNPTNEFIFPSVFHAGAHLADPLGEWYLYLAPHDPPGGIMLMYADSLEGPWTEFGANPIIARNWSPHFSVSHVSSPDAIWNEGAGEVFLYFHGENSVTRYASSADGIAFEYGGVAVSNAMGGSNVIESSYARVFDHPDPASAYNYGMFYMVNERDNIRRIRLAESVDGVGWTIRDGYVVTPGPEEGANVSGGNLWKRGSQLYVIYHGSSGKSYARTIDPTLRQVGTVPVLLHAASGVGADTGRVAAPEIVTDAGGTYLFYESGDRLGATIAWAKDVGGAAPAAIASDPQNPVFAHCAAPGSDEFEGSTLAAGVWDRVVRPSAARHAVSAGRLTVPTYWGGVAAASLLQQELPIGPWEVTTKVTIDAKQTFQQAGLLLYRSDTHYAKLDIGFASPGPTVELVLFKDGVNRQDTSAPQGVGVRTLWLRLASDGTVIRARVSYDGASFADYGRPIPVAEAGFTHVGPYAMRGTKGAPEITASFEWFRLSPTNAAYAACSA